MVVECLEKEDISTKTLADLVLSSDLSKQIFKSPVWLSKSGDTYYTVEGFGSYIVPGHLADDKETWIEEREVRTLNVIPLSRVDDHFYSMNGEKVIEILYGQHEADMVYRSNS